MPETLHLSAFAYDILKRSVGTHLPESGAVIGAPMDGDETHITHARFDTDAGWGKDFYAPSEEIGRVLCQWARDRIRFLGIVHSHGDNLPNQLSGIDLHSAAAIMQKNNMPFIYMGLFWRRELSMYRVLPDGSAEKMHFIVDPEN
ncbi:MAG: hypothetical protein IJZ02_01880 [Clostridia bacterium]|nr:hypothetical protein [Clostridia bacterium]